MDRKDLRDALDWAGIEFQLIHQAADRPLGSEEVVNVLHEFLAESSGPDRRLRALGLIDRALAILDRAPQDSQSTLEPAARSLRSLRAFVESREPDDSWLLGGN